MELGSWIFCLTSPEGSWTFSLKHHPCMPSVCLWIMDEFGQKMSPNSCQISMILTVWTQEYLNKSAENLIKIGSVVSELWPGKVKSQVMHSFEQAAYLLGNIQYGGVFDEVQQPQQQQWQLWIC